MHTATDLVDTGGVSEVDGLPAIHKCAQGEVHVLNGCSALPATDCNDGLAAPDSSCSVEVEEAASCKLNILLTLAVKIQRDFLSLQILYVNISWHAVIGLQMLKNQKQAESVTPNNNSTKAYLGQVRFIWVCKDPAGLHVANFWVVNQVWHS